MQEKKIVTLLPKFYRWNTYNTSMFFSIRTQVMFFPTMTIDQAITNYYKLTGIEEDDWDRESIRATYTRLQSEFFNDMKSECTEKNNRAVKS
jgi:hypothetical protein